MDINSIGESLFNFALWVSVIVTIGGLILATSGIQVQYPVSMLTLSVTTFYNFAEQLVKKPVQIHTGIQWLDKIFNKAVNATQFGVGVLTALTGVALNLAFVIMTIFFSLVYVIYYMLPPQFNYLALPLFFIGGLAQLFVWYYIMNKIYNAIASLISGVKP